MFPAIKNIIVIYLTDFLGFCNRIEVSVLLQCGATVLGDWCPKFWSGLPQSKWAFYRLMMRPSYQAQVPSDKEPYPRRTWMLLAFVTFLLDRLRVISCIVIRELFNDTV
jgi:hypothetical protein